MFSVTFPAMSLYLLIAVFIQINRPVTAQTTKKFQWATDPPGTNQDENQRTTTRRTTTKTTTEEPRRDDREDVPVQPQRPVTNQQASGGNPPLSSSINDMLKSMQINPFAQKGSSGSNGNAGNTFSLSPMPSMGNIFH